MCNQDFPEAEPIVSVLIGSRNRPHVLCRCLESVIRQDFDRFELLVLDDASDLPVAPLVHEKLRDTRIRVIRSEAPLGVAGGRNLLMSEARGSILVVLDDDAEFADDNALGSVVKVFEDYPSVGIVAFKIVDYQGQTTRLLVPFGKRVRLKYPDIVDHVKFVSYYHGGGHALRKTVWERTSGYQPDMVYGEEELELSYRAISQGFQILYVPNIVIHHYPQASVLHGADKLYYHVRNRLFLAHKYLPWYAIPSYLAFWLTRYFLTSIRRSRMKEFARGITDGLSWVQSVPRTPLSVDSIKYIRRHYGRLWY